MKFTCGLCYPRVKKYFSSIQEGHDHAREHFDRMRGGNDELTVERVHQMCFPRPRLWVEPRPIETIDIDDEPSESSEHVRESVEDDFEGRPTETIVIDLEPSASTEHLRQLVQEDTNSLESRRPASDRITRIDFIRKRRNIYARIKKYVRNNKLECRLCRKVFMLNHPCTGFHGQSASLHSDTHLRIRYWKCAFCPKTYHLRRILSDHLASCHKDQRDIPGGGTIDGSLQYVEQILDMLSRCFDHGRSVSTGNGGKDVK